MWSPLTFWGLNRDMRFGEVVERLQMVFSRCMSVFCWLKVLRRSGVFRCSVWLHCLMVLTVYRCSVPVVGQSLWMFCHSSCVELYRCSVPVVRQCFWWCCHCSGVELLRRWGVQVVFEYGLLLSVSVVVTSWWTWMLKKWRRNCWISCRCWRMWETCRRYVMDWMSTFHCRSKESCQQCALCCYVT